MTQISSFYSHLTLEKLSLLSSTRKKYRGGRLGLVFNNKQLSASLMQDGKLETFQFAKWKVSASHTTLTVIGVYRPLNSAGLGFLEECTELIAEQLINDTNLVIMGDFKFHVNNLNDDDVANLPDNMTVLGMVQDESGPTQHSNNTLDLIFMKYISDIRVHRRNLSTFISDHCFIECNTSIQKTEIAQKNVTYIPIKDIEYERMSDVISIIRDLNFNGMVKDFNETW